VISFSFSQECSKKARIAPPVEYSNDLQRTFIWSINEHETVNRMETQRARCQFRTGMAHLREGNKGSNHAKNFIENPIRSRQVIGSNEFPDFIEVR
jgi:hypothetical protein